jgi:hypothetical protein
MRTRDDIFTEVLVRNNRTTTDGFITDLMLKNWFLQAHTWAMAAHKWPWTEGRVATTFATGGGDNTDEWYFEGYKADSFRMVVVGGKRIKLLTFADYQIFKQENPQSNERVGAQFGRILFINSLADISGTLVAYGQYLPYIDVTNETAVTLFSDYDEEGNDAIITKMTAFLRTRESGIGLLIRGKPVSAAIIAEQNAIALLESVWKRVEDEQYKYQTTPERGGWFDRIDVLRGRGINEVNNPNQYPFANF